MMEAKYSVYYKVGEDDQEPVITYLRGELIPSRTRRKYAGKKAKIKAIEQLTGEILDSHLSTDEIDQYIDKNIFRTSLWKEYRRRFQKFANEVEELEMRYFLNIKLSTQAINPADERLIYMIKKEMENNRLDEYEGLKNPICSVSIQEIK